MCTYSFLPCLWSDFHGLILLFSLVVPFLRFGEDISGSNHFPLTSDALRKVVTGQASREVLLSIFHAVWTFYSLLKFWYWKWSLSTFLSKNLMQPLFWQLLGWLIAAPFILGILYVVFLPSFKYLLHKFSAVPSSPRQPLPHPEINIKVRDV